MDGKGGPTSCGCHTHPVGSLEHRHLLFFGRGVLCVLQTLGEKNIKNSQKPAKKQSDCHGCFR